MAVQAPEARELSVEEQEERAEVAKLLENQIISDIARGRQDLWQLCEHLYQFHGEQGWSALGYDTQEEWLAQPEIGMSRAEYMRCVRRWRVYVINREVPVERLQELDHSKLDIVQTAVQKNLKPLEDILRDVKGLGARDLRDEYIGGDDGASMAQETKPQGGAADEDDIIEGTVVDEAHSGSESSSAQVDEKVVHAAAAVDSWLEVGGDRRKAQRNWKRFREAHPLFIAMARVDALMNGDEDAPSRDEVRDDWQAVCQTLHLSLDQA